MIFLPFEKILEEKLGLIEEMAQLQTSVVIAIKKIQKSLL